jgi:DNA-binding transcriptional LysR family regulator
MATVSPRSVASRPMPDRHEIETRDLEYFVVLAEELHFGRAAERLSIAQPGLSKALRRLELRLGLQLLERDNRHVSLTPAGEALLKDGRRALDAMSAAVRSARRAAEAEGTVTLVMKPGGDAGLLPAILAAYEAEPDGRPVEVLFGGVRERIDCLHDGRADVAILYAPLDNQEGLESVTLQTEDRVAVLPRDHRLADRPELTLADLEGEPMPRWRGMEADGEGPEVADMAELTQLVALRRAVAILPPAAIGAPHPDIVTVPVVDAQPNRLLLAWKEGDQPDSVRALIRTAEELTRH